MPVLLLRIFLVATVLTACGIETWIPCDARADTIVATVLTACGIETIQKTQLIQIRIYQVATVLTACGIETGTFGQMLWPVLPCCNSAYRLRY